MSGVADQTNGRVVETVEVEPAVQSLVIGAGFSRVRDAAGPSLDAYSPPVNRDDDSAVTDGESVVQRKVGLVRTLSPVLQLTELESRDGSSLRRPRAAIFNAAATSVPCRTDNIS